MIFKKINPENYKRIVFFTGAGMSAESGIPTYRGKGGIWNEYRWEEYACQEAFEKQPEKVLKFHELRRTEALKCKPHNGYRIISELQSLHTQTYIVTQNIDGMHQRASLNNIIELHGSLWRLRCEFENLTFNDLKNGTYETIKCDCGNWLRPDIIWFQDMLKREVISFANEIIGSCDLFISIGTSSLVWPAAGYPKLAKSCGAFCIEINPENTEISYIYDENIRLPASKGLDLLFH